MCEVRYCCKNGDADHKCDSENCLICEWCCNLLMEDQLQDCWSECEWFRDQYPETQNSNFRLGTYVEFNKKNWLFKSVESDGEVRIPKSQCEEVDGEHGLIFSNFILEKLKEYL